MIEKTTFNSNGERLDIGVMFTKVDRENRTVSGFATLNNRDSHGDEISYQGSREAFARFRGGIREMHQPNAVGTLVDFEDMNKYDPDSDKVYKGIYVQAKVSKGAPDTWEKVLDGTLKGFSIGGKAKRKFKKQDPETGDEWLVIDEYDLHEISLVDNPANPLATVLTVQKIGDEYVYSDDDIMEKQIMNILIEEQSGEVILSEDSERDGFTNIGWTDSIDNTEKIRRCLDEYKTSTEDSDEDIQLNTGGDVTAENEREILLKEGETVILRGVDNTDEGGATVAKNIKKDADVEAAEVEETEDVETDEVEKSEESTEDDVVKSEDSDDEEETDEVEKAADVSEVEEDSTDADDIVSKVVSAVADEIAKATEAAKESKDAVEGVQSSFDNKFADLEKSVKDELESLTARLEDVESTTAVKKSADVADEDDAEEDDEEASFWRGSGFLSANDLVRS